MEIFNGVPHGPDTLSTEVFTDLMDVTQKLTTYDPITNPAVRNVQNGHTFEKVDPESGSVSVTSYHRAGDREYAQFLAEKYGDEMEVGEASLLAFVDLRADHGDCSLEAQLFVLSDQRVFVAFSFATERASALTTPDSSDCYYFLDRFGLASQWYDFEHSAFDQPKNSFQHDPDFGHESMIELNNQTVDAITNGLAEFLPGEG